MGKFNIVQFRKETAQTRASSSLKALARNAAKASFNNHKKEMIQDFDGHLVTQELKAGAEGSNVSNTLDGKGNLYSFIGFEQGDEPTAGVRDALELGTQLDTEPEIEVKKDKTLFKFRVVVPSNIDLEAITPMPWENGLSWLRGIERGISGFGHYIYWKLDALNKYPNGSRSGTGLQVKNLLRGGRYKPVSYVSQIIKEFLGKFKK